MKGELQRSMSAIDMENLHAPKHIQKALVRAIHIILDVKMKRGAGQRTDDILIMATKTFISMLVLTPYASANGLVHASCRDMTTSSANATLAKIPKNIYATKKYACADRKNVLWARYAVSETVKMISAIFQMHINLKNL